MKKFDVPVTYRSGIISRVKDIRKIKDPRKQDFSPTTLEFDHLTLVLPRHFGFCYGVENAIERSFRAIKDNPDKRIFLLSEMIHNPAINEDLLASGLRFIFDTSGRQLIEWNEITNKDIVIIPAFGTTLEIAAKLHEIGAITESYNTTCPFVEKVWKRSAEIGREGFSVVIHGKYKHEETRATFSHSNSNTPSVIVRDMREAELLAEFIRGQRDAAEFASDFAGKYSDGFDVQHDLKKLGVVNQTTMLATETEEITQFLRSVMMELHGENWPTYFADTRDTLCYATHDNQQSTLAAAGLGASLALVVGGYNSSNTSQIADILAQSMPTYFIRDADEIIDENTIQHFDYPSQQLQTTHGWLASEARRKVIVTSGASCPDSILDGVIQRVLEVTSCQKNWDEVLAKL
ncbi:MAG: 4-hydroxy-3-methylbut-2-enyl diphosphate reductase [Flavobacteriales bacterium]